MTLTGQQLEQLFRLRQRQVFAYFRGEGVSHEDAKDLTQETFIAAFGSLPQFRGEAKLETWLTSIAQNVLRNHLRARNRIKRKATEIPLDRSPGESSDDEGLPLSDRLADQRPSSAHDQAVARETVQVALRVLRSLPPEMRNCMLLLVWQGLYYRDIATALQIPIQRVKSLIHEARKKIGKELRKQFDADGYPPMKRSP